MNTTPDAADARGLRRIVAATRYSLAGLAAAWRGEAAFRQEVVAAIVLIPAALWVGTGPAERVLLIGSVFIVLIVEVLNSAVENTIDRIGPERHELSGRAKDLGSAAVFLSLLLAGITWGLVIWGRIAG